MRIMLADDHPVVRNGLKRILAEGFPRAEFVDAGDGNEVLSRLATGNCDLLVLDIHMPGLNGLEVLEETKKLRSRLPVIVLSVCPEDQYALRCLRSGAAAYLNKESAPEELVTVARKVLAGGRFLSAHLAEMMAFSLAAPESDPPHGQLSNRELEVMTMIAAGKRLMMIAEELHLSVKTVGTYRGRVLQKMHMLTNAELTRYVIEHKLVA